VQERLDDFLGYEATINLFPDIEVHNRFSLLEETVVEPELTVESKLELTAPEGKSSVASKSPAATLNI
jgi:hypothetical protein